MSTTDCKSPQTSHDAGSVILLTLYVVIVVGAVVTGKVLAGYALLPEWCAPAATIAFIVVLLHQILGGWLAIDILGVILALVSPAGLIAFAETTGFDPAAQIPVSALHAGGALIVLLILALPAVQYMERRYGGSACRT